MAYNVDRRPDPDELPSGHWEYDQVDGESIRIWVREEALDSEQEA
jgi:hypothetical protein